MTEQPHSLLLLSRSLAVESVENTPPIEDVEMEEEEQTATAAVDPKKKRKKQKASKRKIAVCVKCKTLKTIVAKGACKPCYEKHFRPKVKCSNCGGMKPRNGKTEDDDPVCLKCYGKLGLQPEKKCGNCGDMKPQHGKTEAGEPVCKKCYDELGLQPQKKCSNCGEMKPQCGTTEDGEPVCKKCYRELGLQPEKKCSNCGEMKHHHGTTEIGEPVCQKCYNELGLRPEKKCSNCGEMKPQASRTEDGEPVCQKCYRELGLQPEKKCSNCGELKRHAGTTENGEPVCLKCYKELGLWPEKKCSNCGAVEHHHGTTADGEPVCLKCYDVLGLRPETKCSHCGDLKPQHGTTDDGEALCKRCYRPYLCDLDDCGHASRDKVGAASHARTHGPWKGKSTMEEWLYKTLDIAGFSKSWAPLDPDEPPDLGTFWYNARVFSELLGEGGSKLECDFMIRLNETEVLWVEPHGLHHYQQRPGGSPLATQQEHDRRRRVFATEVLPKRPGWAGLAFHEIPCGIEFEAFKPRFIDTLNQAVLPMIDKEENEEEKGGPDGELEQSALEELEQSSPKRQRTTINQFFHPLVLATRCSVTNVSPPLSVPSDFSVRF